VGLSDTILKGTHPGTIWQFLFLIGYCLKKSSLLKLLGKMEPNLAESIYVRSSIKLLHLVPFGQQTLPSLVPFGQVVSEEKIKI
jgi:hypothetical protein